MKTKTPINRPPGGARTPTPSRHRIALTLLGAVAAASMLTGCAPDPRRSIVLITVSGLGSGDLARQHPGGPLMPNLARAAAQGTRFDAAFTTAPFAPPAHASIFTGQLPREHGIRAHEGRLLATDHPVLAEIFEHRGYATAAFIGQACLGSAYGFRRGFATFVEPGIPNPSSGRIGADTLVTSVTEWLKEHDGVPFFLWINLADLLPPWRPRAPYNALFPSDPATASRAFVDEGIGVIVDAIQDSATGESTTIIMTADAGPAEFPGTLHLGVDTSTTRVPLLILGPQATPGLTVATDVSIVDLFPTLLSMAGTGEAPLRSSRDLSPALRGKPLEERSIRVENLAPQMLLGAAPTATVMNRDHSTSPPPAIKTAASSLSLDATSTLDRRHHRAADRRLHESLLASQGMFFPSTAVQRPKGSATRSDHRIESQGHGLVLFAQGRRALAAGDLESSLSVAVDMIALFPDSPAALELLAESQAALGWTTDARASLERLRRLRGPGQGTAHLATTLAREALLHGHPEQALELIDSALAVETSPQRLVLRAQAMRKTGAIADAEEMLAEAVQVDDAPADIHLAHAQLLAASGRSELASRAYEAALIADPLRASLHREYGRHLAEWGNPERSALHLRRAQHFGSPLDLAAANRPAIGPVEMPKPPWHALVLAHTEGLSVTAGSLDQAIAEAPHQRPTSPENRLQMYRQLVRRAAVDRTVLAAPHPWIEEAATADRLAEIERNSIIDAAIHRHLGTDPANTTTAQLAALATAVVAPDNAYRIDEERLARCLESGMARTVVLREGEVEVTAGRFRYLLSVTNPRTMSNADAARALLRRLELRARILVGCRASGFDSDPEVLQTLSAARNREITKAARNTEVLKWASKDAEAVERFFAAHRLRFASPLKIDVLRVRLPIRDHDPMEIRRRLRQAGRPRTVRDLNRIGDRFDVPVRRLGLMAVDELRALDPAAARVAPALAVGSTSEPFRSGDFVQIIHVAERLEPHVSPLESVRDEVVRAFARLHRDALEAAWQEEYLESAGWAFDEAAVRNLMLRHPMFY